MSDDLRTSLPPPLHADISLRTLTDLTGKRLAEIDLTVLLVYLVDMVQESALPWLAEQFSLTDGDGWDLAESDEAKRELIRGAIELHRYKGTPWSIREILRRLGFGEIELIEGIGRLKYDGTKRYNGWYIHGDPGSWPVYRVILNQPVTNDQAGSLIRTLESFAPVRCKLASLEYTRAAIRYNGTAGYDRTYNYGSVTNG